MKRKEKQRETGTHIKDLMVSFMMHSVFLLCLTALILYFIS